MTRRREDHLPLGQDGPFRGSQLRWHEGRTSHLLTKHEKCSVHRAGTANLPSSSEFCGLQYMLPLHSDRQAIVYSTAHFRISNRTCRKLLLFLTVQHSTLKALTQSASCTKTLRADAFSKQLCSITTEQNKDTEKFSQEQPCLAYSTHSIVLYSV